ncbi:MAG: penicillin-binding protein 1B [Chromatiales bacterium]|nr:penicillin-binding protein 1B [Chromatiales bacterium]
MARRSRRPRRNLRQYLSRRVIFTLAGLALLAVLALATWVWLLDRQIVQQFEGRRWDLPAQVYARPLELYAGQRLSAEELQRELTALGYAATPAVRTQGTFARLSGRIVLMTRPFQFWDGAQPAQKATISFGAGGIVALTDERGSELSLLRLDPPFIGNIFTAHGEDRIVLGPDQVPELLLASLKIVEDRDFDKHGGISLRAIARAMWANIRAGGIEQGGSTLTQQLVRSYFLDNSRTLTRKLREALMSMLLELHFDKPDLLNAYVNEIYLGQAGDRAIHGFGLASQFYFGKPLTELEPQETALLVAIVRGPSWYDPRRHPERTRKRRDMVLDLMAQFGLISEAAAGKARQRDLGVRGKATTFASYNPTFMDLVRRELHADYKEDDLLSAGLRIMTTLDPRIQALAEQRLKEGLDELEISRKRKPGSLDGAIVVTGTQTPDVLAIVGGRNARMQGFNRALDAKRPIGSLVKPVVYLAGFESGRYTAATQLEDAPLNIRLDTGKIWSPQNYDHQYRGPVPAIRALAESLNTPTVRIGMDVGPKKVAGLLKSLGMSKAPPPLPSLLLGAVDLSPMEVAQVYNSLGNGGFHAPLKAVRAVLDVDGKPLERYQLKIDRAADPSAVAQLTTSMLQVVDRGTARGARRWLPPGLAVAGKTGTSDDLRDSWFAGFTNDHVVVVWVGADDNTPTGLSGASGALPIWARLVAGFGDLGYEALPTEDLADVSFDYATGMMSRADCGDLVTVPLPAGTVLPAKPDCLPESDNLTRRGIEWLKGLLN